MKEASRRAILRAAKWALQLHKKNGIISSYQVNNLQKRIRLILSIVYKSKVVLSNIPGKKSAQTRGAHPPRLGRGCLNENHIQSTMIELIRSTKEIRIKIETVVRAKKSKGV